MPPDSSPPPPPRLLAVLAELGPIDEEFPDIDTNLPALEEPEP